MRTALLAAVLALAGCAGGELTDDWFPGNVPADGEGRPSHLVFKVVDDATGAGLAGATVHLHKEATYPIPEQPPAAVAEAVADAHGWVRLPLDGLHGTYDWIYVSAPGYGPQGLFAPWLDFAVRLRPGVDVPFEIRDELNRPVAGAQVDWHLGCGHTPAVRVVTTDAQGRGVLAGIDLEAGEAWIKARGLHSDYLNLNWEPGQSRAVIHVAAAPVFTGRVLDHEGRPIAGAVVGAPFCHRGPWCLTRADGTFELVGLDPGEGLQVARSPAHDLTVEGNPSPAGHGCTLQLPKPGEDPPGWRAGRKLRVRVQFEDGTTVTDCEVLMVHTGNGATTQQYIQPEGQALFGEESTGDAGFDLPPGPYECIVEHARGLTQPLRVPVQVAGGPDDAPLEQLLTVKPARLKKLRFDGVPPHATVWVASAGRPAWDLTEEAHAAGLVPLPMEGPAVLKLVADGHTQYVSLERDTEPQTVTWNGPPPLDPTTVEWEEPAAQMPELPDATLEVNVRGTSAPVTVTVDGAPSAPRIVKGEADPIVVPHLPAGSREVVVAAPGFRAWRATITLTKGRTSTVDVTLPPAAR